MYIDHRYEVLESLGTGSWANVYKVRDTRTDKLYTLKLFQYLPSEELYARFSAEEMHHITKIEHPNLSHVVDFGHVGDHVYYISDYFEGNTLNTFKFGRTKVDQLYDIIVQIAYALHALHEQNILHKDLKLENVLYHVEGKDVRVKLIDYGFTKIDPVKDKKYVSGTLPYIAPEIYTGKAPDRRSDFYSLGVILYRICTGSFPYNIDQINALITGNQRYFIPTFPSELNKDIPLPLEKFILILLERNPDNRFNSCEEIISYINRIHYKEYSFSESWSMVNTLRFNSYIVREKYSHQLLDFIPAVGARNGKIISLIGGDGLGKDSILSLFRYHLLSGEYFLFDYSCTKTDHEAFFALIKEYLHSLNDQELKNDTALNKISEKFKSYLFASEKDAKGISQSVEELQIDFQAVRSLLLELSERKPIIFIIRDFQYVHHHTVDFLNFLSGFLVQSRIMVVLSCNDFNKVKQIDHTILVNIPPLSFEETRQYISKLLNTEPNQGLLDAIAYRSAGNPHFIREMLVDMIIRKTIEYSDGLKLPDDLNDYVLPARLLHSIFSRMSRLTSANYQYLQKLSVVQTTLTRELILSILGITDIELYSLLNESTYNEMLQKEDKHYSFSFPEAKARLWDETDPDERIRISQKVLDFYDSKVIHDIPLCKGIISNAEITGDTRRTRDYLLKLYYLLDAEHEQEQAYDTMLRILELDADAKVKVGYQEFIHDLSAFHSKTEMTGFYKQASRLLKKMNKIPEVFEKYLLLGTIDLLSENLKEALKHYGIAENLALTGKQKILCWQYFTQIYTRIDPRKMKHYLDKIAAYDLPQDMQILYIDRLAVYYSIMKDTDKAIKTIETFFAQLPPEHDTAVMIRLAAMHNDLGVFYGDLKNIEEANQHLNMALNIWNRYNIKRFLALIYNNISDLYLKQGFTIQSEHYSDLAYASADELNLPLMKALALLNQGEAKIKMGKFLEAESKLLESQELIERIGNTKYLDSIKRNLALAKSKIRGFGYYFKFLQESEPELIDGYVREINPLVKTYFYYLHEMSNPKKLRKLIRKNVQINYKHILEEEFYHNVLSLLAITEKDYATALNELKMATKFAGDINSNYAMAVFYFYQIICYYGLREYKKAAELIENAKPLVVDNQYNYWHRNIQIMELKLDMVNPEVPLRNILRRTNDLMLLCREEEYYQLIVELYQIRVQLLLELSATEKASACFEEYKRFLEEITLSIAEDDRQNYLLVNQYALKSITKFDLVEVVSRRKDQRNSWNELLVNIANINTLDRIIFLIEKGITQVLSPWQFRLMEYSDRIGSFYTFQSYNCDKDVNIAPELHPYIEKSIKADNLTTLFFQNQNIMVIPLLTGTKRIGVLLLADDGELEFTKHEISIMRSIKQHLTALLVRIRDYTQITMRIDKMNQLMSISHELMRVTDTVELEHQIVSAFIDITNSSRGFLIKRDAEGNNLYQIQLDRSKQILSSISGISKTALSVCQATMEPVSTFNAIEDNRFKNSISVQDYEIHTIFCTPIVVDNVSYGIIYLDNLMENNREMYLNQEILTLLIEQVTVAFKNAAQYAAVLQKSSEINAFEQLKDEFMAIVAHELNTPLTTLQGYVSRLKRNLYVDEEERVEIVQKIETSVKKLILTIGDITTMNNYNIKTSLTKSIVPIEEIIELVQQEVEILSRKRKMFIKLEIEKDLPQLYANWEALHLMLYNIVLNAIRFTNDFGTIIIGARRSAFQQEKLDGKDAMVIYVQDNGIGIPEYQIKNVFRKFYELNEIYAHKSGMVEYRSSGLGLGLATSRRIAELHGGNIWIKSRENEGTTVFMTIPFKSGGN